MPDEKATLEARLAAIRSEANAKERERANIEARIDQATAALDEALRRLQTLGFSTPDSASLEADRLRVAIDGALEAASLRLHAALPHSTGDHSA